MRLIIAGSRNYAPERADTLVAQAMTLIPRPAEILSGGATGIDQAGERWAKANEIPVDRYPADWQKHGRSAGPLRNRAMAATANALLLIWDGTSRGSANMLREAQARHLLIVTVVEPIGEPA